MAVAWRVVLVRERHAAMHAYEDVVQRLALELVDGRVGALQGGEVFGGLETGVTVVAEGEEDGADVEAWRADEAGDLIGHGCVSGGRGG